MAGEKTDKQLIKRRKFLEVDIPITKSRIELIGNSPKELKDRTIKLDMTRQLKGKNVELTVKIRIEDNKAVAYPLKIKLLSYFIRRMIRKRISYVEDSFTAPTQESMLRIKPFLITKRKVSRVIRKTLRNKAKNWIEDYLSDKKDNEVFSEIFTNRLQKSLSLVLKKTYPLSLCEIRILEIIRPLAPEEVPKIKPRKPVEKSIKSEEIEPLDQLKEIEEERIRQAELAIKETQEKAANLEFSDSKESEPAIQEEPKEEKVIKRKKPKKSDLQTS